MKIITKKEGTKQKIRVCMKKKIKNKLLLLSRGMNFNLMNSKIESSLYFCAMRNNHIRQHILEFLFSFIVTLHLRKLRSGLLLNSFLLVFTFLHLVILHFCFICSSSTLLLGFDPSIK